MQVDFLLIGQGLAGTLLAQELMRRGRSVSLVDDRWSSAASLVAAGLMTPLTGRRFSLTKEYPSLFSSAQSCFTELGVFCPFEVYRMFVDIEQREKALKRIDSPMCSPYISQIIPMAGRFDSGLTDHFGGIVMHGAWIDLAKLLRDARKQFVDLGLLIDAVFHPDEVEITHTGIRWRECHAKAIVYCDGYKSAQRGPFTYLPWQPAKGEALTLRSNIQDRSFILNREGWALPLGQGLWRTGTNWHWDTWDETPTETQKEKLLARFKGFFNSETSSSEVIAHVAGVRPCTSDNHPFMGTHPQQRHNYLFNGFGPRGTVWVPAMALEMASYLCNGHPLRPECDITRFLSASDLLTSGEYI